MRVYVIKRKGYKNYHAGLFHYMTGEFDDGTTIFIGKYFMRKKDARKYLDDMPNKEMFEIIPMESV